MTNNKVEDERPMDRRQGSSRTQCSWDRFKRVWLTLLGLLRQRVLLKKRWGLLLKQDGEWFLLELVGRVADDFAETRKALGIR